MNQKRLIVLDTETTGLESTQGHRIIEIGCVELINRQFTGKTFHKYINPEREVEQEAITVHGINNDFLKDKPLFKEILEEFIEFIKDTEIIAHNASFDIGFINHEIKLISKKSNPVEKYATIFDTLALARKKFPGQRNTLDAICKRYKIDLTSRKTQGHGALLDAKLLAEAYLLMTAGGQSSLFSNFETTETDKEQKTKEQSNKLELAKKETTIKYADKDELDRHQNLLTKIKEKSGKCLWENEQN